MREELKRCSFAASDILNVRNSNEYQDAVDAAGPVFFLAVDWQIGPDLVLEILEKNRRVHKLESRPTFLFAAKLDENVIAVAAEYYVNKVHTGTITGETIRTDVVQLVKEAKDLSQMRQLLIQVETCRTTGDWVGATQVLGQLHSRFPDNMRIMVELAENHLEMDEWKNAETFLSVVVEKEPQYARARHLLARCFLKRGDMEEAIECLKDAQLISPYNVNRLVEMGGLFLEMSKPHDAKKTFDQILKIAPKSKNGVSGKASSMLVLGEVNEALGILRESASTRELAAVFNTTAIMAINKGNYEAGMNLYQIAKDAIGDRPKVQARLMYNMGIGYYKWKRSEESMKCFQQALKFDPTFDDAAYNVQVMQRSTAKSESVPGQTSIGGDTVAAAASPKSSFATDLDHMFDEDFF